MDASYFEKWRKEWWIIYLMKCVGCFEESSRNVHKQVYFLFEADFTFSGWSSVHRSLHPQSMAYQRLLSASRYAHQHGSPTYELPPQLSQKCFSSPSFQAIKHSFFVIDTWGHILYPEFILARCFCLSILILQRKMKIRINYNVFQFCLVTSLPLLFSKFSSIKLPSPCHR